MATVGNDRVGKYLQETPRMKGVVVSTYPLGESSEGLVFFNQLLKGNFRKVFLNIGRFNIHPHKLSVFIQINQDVFIDVSGLSYFLMTQFDIGVFKKHALPVNVNFLYYSTASFAEHPDRLLWQTDHSSCFPCAASHGIDGRYLERRNILNSHTSGECLSPPPLQSAYEQCKARFPDV